MKKIIALLCLNVLLLCACSNNGSNDRSAETGSSIPAVEYKASSTEAVQKQGDKLRRPEKEPQISAPKGSIDFSEACKLIDNTDKDSLNLLQSASEYKKYYNETVKYLDTDWYSVYLYLEENENRIFTGSNILVSCDGKRICRKTITSDYRELTGDRKSANDDKPYTELFPDAKLSPNDALLLVAKKDIKSLGLSGRLSDYLFNVSDTVTEFDSAVCYQIIPVAEYEDSQERFSSIYVNIDGSGRMYLESTGTAEKYIPLESE